MLQESWPSAFEIFVSFFSIWFSIFNWNFSFRKCSANRSRAALLNEPKISILLYTNLKVAGLGRFTPYHMGHMPLQSPRMTSFSMTLKTYHSTRQITGFLISMRNLGVRILPRECDFTSSNSETVNLNEKTLENSLFPHEWF